MTFLRRSTTCQNNCESKPPAMLQLAMVLISMFSAQAVFSHGLSAADQASMISGGYLQYIRLGASHMITGYDHLLFLLGVVFFLDKFRDITKFITAFTIGHSITLIFATFMGISANYFLIDAAIALTVVYKGFDNLGGFQKFFKMDSPNLIVLVFLFGLIHGFGLSTRLQMLPLGNEGLLLKILSFNLGVEVGQIAALVVMLLVLKGLRNRKIFTRFSLVTNSGLVVAGLLLFAFQMSGYVGNSDATSSEYQDTVTLIIPANGALEYKFELAEGAVLGYSWKTDGSPLYFDFHGDMKFGKPGEFESFEKAEKSQSKGELKAPFAGATGWYWKNKTEKPIEVILETYGEYEILGIM